MDGEQFYRPITSQKQLQDKTKGNDNQPRLLHIMYKQRTNLGTHQEAWNWNTIVKLLFFSF
jgi:hypothetical protein